MIKGGVWKNTEDEILKAAVMKYGKNQWARISSLLVRKSAKQCKARWYEWLDPSIKKTEWTREEDEKLLHLAKLMPTQWRTIAPIVGRTPAQCLERYEKLLDAACDKDESYDPADDPRRLRPGEIDPNPESKPARPDPVDMDEDEKEMLSEARARLANTKGKKAKRKAREKQLEEARRLASLQKRRELKAAGLDVKQKKRKLKHIDYNAEIAFEKKPPPGFFDTSGEQSKNDDSEFLGKTLQELEGKRRDVEESKMRREDAQKNKLLAEKNVPQAVARASRLNDPEQIRRRSKLMLPSPQVSDQELQQIARLGAGAAQTEGVLEEALQSGDGATQTLLANYAATPASATPMRTPMRTPQASGGDAILMEAQNLARLTQATSALEGGENPELHPSDFTGVTPKRTVAATPNTVATPLLEGTPGRTGMTPGRGDMSGSLAVAGTPSSTIGARTPGHTPGATPIRDGLGINDEDMTPMISEDERSLKMRTSHLRADVKSRLAALPAPKNEYQVVVPELEDDSKDDKLKMEEDMEDVLKRREADEAAARALELSKRTTVLRRELPRPATGLTRDFLLPSQMRKLAPYEQAQELLDAEMTALIQRDNAKYPIKEGKKKAKHIPEVDTISEELLAEAAGMVAKELEALGEAIASDTKALGDALEKEVAEQQLPESFIFLPSSKSWGPSRSASLTDRLTTASTSLTQMTGYMEKDAKKAAKLENKLHILTAGHQTRCDKLSKQCEARFGEVSDKLTELECFRRLQSREQLSGPMRLESLKGAVQEQVEREKKLQVRFHDLTTENERLQALLTSDA